MNNAELEIVTEWYGRFKTYEERMQFIQDKFGISLIIVTMGGDGAMVNENGIVYRHTGFAVPVADTIGSGDAFLAGFLSEMLQGSNVLNALTFACAMGAFIATHRGACPQYEKQEVYDQLFHLK